MLRSAVVETATWLVELGVGIACLVIGVMTLRGSRLRVVGVLLVIAGLAAAGHATVQLAG
jgi:putative copper export protein